MRLFLIRWTIYPNKTLRLPFTLMNKFGQSRFLCRCVDRRSFDAALGTSALLLWVFFAYLTHLICLPILQINLPLASLSCFRAHSRDFVQSPVNIFPFESYGDFCLTGICYTLSMRRYEEVIFVGSCCWRIIIGNEFVCGATCRAAVDFESGYAKKIPAYRQFCCVRCVER